MQDEIETQDSAKSSVGLTPTCLAGLTIGVAAIGAEALVMSPMLEDIGHSLGASAATMGITVAAYGLALAIAAPVFGLFGYRIDRVRVMLSGLGLFVLGTLGCGLAVGPWSLMAARVACGISAGAYLPACYAFVGDAVPYERRARVMGRVMFGWSLSLVVGVPLGGIIGQFLGWRFSFVAVAMAGLVAFLILVLSRKAALAVHQHQPSDKAVLRKLPRGVLPILGVTFLNMGGFYIVYTYLGTAVRDAQGVKSAGAGAYVLCYGVGLAFSTLRGHLLDRFGKVRASSIALLLLGPLLATMSSAVGHPIVLVLTMMVWGILQGTVITGLNTVLTNQAGPAKGLATALNSSLTYLAVALGATAGGIIMDRGPGFTAICITAAVLSILSCLTLRTSKIVA